MTTAAILGLSFGLAVLMMTITWFVARRMDFYSLVDSVWAFGIGLLGVGFGVLGSGTSNKKSLATVLALAWSLRLGTHLAIRLRGDFPREDKRYEALKLSWNGLKWYLFFLFQGFSQVIFSVPFLLLAQDPSSNLTLLSWFGIVIFLIGYIGESWADWQLKKIRSQNKDQKRVCNVGLWKYSRHPNYFFEWLLWSGIALVALSSPWGPVGLISPVAMYLTLNYFTGIPAVEKQALVSKGDLYREYQNQTAAFFPRNFL